ncbi:MULTISPECIES: hypothetical protein [Pseudomonas]|uniref:hypothetical protein n=1 Tax=Pseudomonas TaxID=286 RepID=UPI0022710400|nr:hypothetical protein [Pseudomonas putida]WAB96130.1 hypothetical protein OSW16_16330 [Pseudomonas putida]
MRSLIMIVDRQYGEGHWWQGHANQPFDFGPMHYPADIQVHLWAPRLPAMGSEAAPFTNVCFGAVSALGSS